MKLISILLFGLLAGDIFCQPNCSAPATGFVPLNDLGTGISPVTGLMGGLYPNGSNALPATHKNAGLQLASEVQSLDQNGNPDAVNGKMVWLSIGLSNTTQEAQQFILQANAFASKNPNLTLVDGAQGGQPAQSISDPKVPSYATYWSTVSTRLTAAGVNAKQVQVIWLKEANPVGATPAKVYYDSLVVQLKRIAKELKVRFPNVKLCYMASRISARYATTTLNPEPHSYWTGWAVKKVIEDQINGDTKLAYAGTAAKSPWLAWGIYMWSDGNTPQATNPKIFYTCPTDFKDDGTHPSLAGAQKVAGFLLDFFSTDPTTTPWFLKAGSVVTGLEDSAHELHIYPNPFSVTATVDLGKFFSDATLTVYNSLGRPVKQIKNSSQQTILLDRENLTSGFYVVHLQQGREIIRKRLIITDRP